MELIKVICIIHRTYSIAGASFEDSVAYETIVFVVGLFVVRDQLLFLPKRREGVVHVQLFPECQLGSAVARRSARDIHIVLVVWRLRMRLAVLWSPRVVGNCSLLKR